MLALSTPRFAQLDALEKAYCPDVFFNTFRQKRADPPGARPFIVSTSRPGFVANACVSRGVARSFSEFLSWQDSSFVRIFASARDRSSTHPEIEVRLPQACAEDTHLLDFLRREADPLCVDLSRAAYWYLFQDMTRLANEALWHTFPEHAAAAAAATADRAMLWPTQACTLKNMIAQLFVARSLKDKGNDANLASYTTFKVEFTRARSAAGFVLCGDVGAGKTAVAAAYCAVARDTYRRRGPAHEAASGTAAAAAAAASDAAAAAAATDPCELPVLVVAPSSCHAFWRESFRAHAGVEPQIVTPHKLLKEYAKMQEARARDVTIAGPLHLLFENGQLCVRNPPSKGDTYLKTCVILDSDVDDRLVPGQHVHVKFNPVTCEGNCFALPATVMEPIAVHECAGGAKPFRHILMPMPGGGRYLAVIVDEAHLLSYNQARAVASLDCESLIGVTASPFGSTANVFNSPNEYMPRAQKNAVEQLMRTFNCANVTLLEKHVRDAWEQEHVVVPLRDRAFDANFELLRRRMHTFTAVSFNRIYAVETLAWEDPADATRYAQSLVPLVAVTAPEPARKRTLLDAASVFGLESCPICLSEPQEHPMAMLPCRHTLCESCASEMLSLFATAQRCPICRANVQNIARVRQPESVRSEAASARRDDERAPDPSPGPAPGPVDERLAWLGEHVQDKIVVFSNFSINVGRIVKFLRSRGVACVSVCGTSSQKNRAAAISKFTDDEHVKVFVATYRTCAAGLNLQTASKVLFFDAPLDAAVLQQAIGRVARSGQQAPVVTFYRFSRPSSDISVEAEICTRLFTEDGDVASASVNLRSRVMRILKELAFM